LARLGPENEREGRPKAGNQHANQGGSARREEDISAKADGQMTFLIFYSTGNGFVRRLIRI
jgi:hypothetical protein